MIKQTLFLTLLAALLSSCGNEPSTSEGSPGLVIGGEGTSTATSSLYQMPTPNELFSLVRDMAGEGHKRLLNPASNADKYISKKSRALNFGVYSTDLIYASYFRLNVEVARYYLTTKKLADGLGVASAFSDADFVRLESNLTRGNTDSLESISAGAYLKAYEKLQEEQMGPPLALVLAGGWVESMHLVIRQIEAFGANDALMTRVADQKVTLEHLVEMMDAHRSDADVDELYKELLTIRDIYDQVNVRRVAHHSASSSGRMVLGDDVSLDLTPSKYQELVQAVDRLRSTIIRPEDKPNA